MKFLSHRVIDSKIISVIKRFLKAEILEQGNYKEDAERYYDALKKRLGKFKLSVAEEKTRIIRFGRFAERDCKAHLPANRVGI